MVNGQTSAVVEMMAMRTTWQGLAVRWELTWGERRGLFPFGGEDRAEPPIDTEKRMRILVEVGHRLRFDDDDEMCEWLRRPSEMWRWHTPLEVMSGSLADLRLFREFVEQGLGA